MRQCKAPPEHLTRERYESTKQQSIHSPLLLSPQLWRINEKIIWRIQYNVQRTPGKSLISVAALLPLELMRIFIAAEIWPASLMISIILGGNGQQPRLLPHNTLSLALTVRILY